MTIVPNLLLAAAAASAQPAQAPAPLRLERVTLAVPTRDVLRATLHAAAPARPPRAGMVSQRLTVGGVKIPLAGSVDVTFGAGETRADLEIRLADVPDGILAIDPNRAPVAWEGVGGDGAAVLAVAGTVDLGDPGETEVPVREVYRAYVTLTDFSVVPGLAAVTVHGLLGLYNPFSFEVAATRIEVTVTAGKSTVLTTQRGGFKLRPRQRGDILIDQDVPLAEAAGGVAEFLRGEPALLQGAIVLRTPRGDRPIPLRISVAR